MMPSEPSHPRRRRSIRLRHFDYRSDALYFVTICTSQRRCLFGKADDGGVQLNSLGEIAQWHWLDVPNHHPVHLEAHVVMPNHVHGVLFIHDNPTDSDVGTAGRAPTRAFADPERAALSAVIRSFKSAAARHINQTRGTPGAPVWQRNYYEHIIRNEAGLTRIRSYIAANPSRWALDRENPSRCGEDPFDRWFSTTYL